MQIGLFSNGQRTSPVAKPSYDEDLFEIVLADELGVREAWISEHGTLLGMQAPDQLPCADLFICKAAALTKQIRMGPGIRPLPFFHPLQVATDCAVCDHLTGGRYMAGFGLGFGDGNGQRGELPGDRRVMMTEAIDLILTAWTAPGRFDWDGEIWQGKDWHIIPQPLTKPHMEVAIACSRTEGTLQLAAEKGFYPLMSWTPIPERLAEMVWKPISRRAPLSCDRLAASGSTCRTFAESSEIDCVSPSFCSADIGPLSIRMSRVKNPIGTNKFISGLD